MRRHIITIPFLLLLALAACGIIRVIRLWGLQPLPRAHPSQRAPLPAGSLVLYAKQAKDVKRPFVLQHDLTAVGAQALALAPGADSPDNHGQAEFTIAPPRAGTYAVWVRARWQDSCSNSIGLAIGDGPERVIGQDEIFSLWHWVRAGSYGLSAAPQQLRIREREDGVALDQILLTPNAAYRPMGPLTTNASEAAIRRFADSFGRSPGHGNPFWDFQTGTWQIAFSLDPNRIPYQYSLTGRARDEDSPALALVKEPAWQGCHVGVSLCPSTNGTYGVVLERSADGQQALHVDISRGPEEAGLHVYGPGIDIHKPLAQAVRLQQWHRLVVERWAWFLRVCLDGQPVVERQDLEPRAGQVGLVVRHGDAVFDDMKILEIPWQMDDGRKWRLPWVQEEGAAWYRPEDRSAALVGLDGALRAEVPGLSVVEVLLWEDPQHAHACAVEAPGLTEVESAAGLRHFRLSDPVVGGPAALRLAVDRKRVRIQRVVVRFGQPRAERFRVGPYHFTQSRIPDPSDYLDFTPEEYRKIQTSPEADKLKRRRKYMNLVGHGGKAAWLSRRKAWQITGGRLCARQPDVPLRYYREIISPLSLRLRLRLLKADATLGVRLYGDRQGGTDVRVCPPGTTDRSEAASAFILPVAGDGQWHTLHLITGQQRLVARLDTRRAVVTPMRQGLGGWLILRAPQGAVEIDDIEIGVQRRYENGGFYPFDQRETDWWRSSRHWIDHGGIACALASNWVSLVAPHDQGMLWHKRPWPGAIAIGFDIEENSEWFGWKEKHSHTHYPFDNIRVALSPTNDVQAGYLLELNSQGRSATLLYRRGKVVARIPQTGAFPMRYRGGHSPYVPRRNHIALVRQGSHLSARVNGREVLTYTDPQPLAANHVGIGGHHTRVNFAQVEIRALSSAGE